MPAVGFPVHDCRVVCRRWAIGQRQWVNGGLGCHPAGYLAFVFNPNELEEPVAQGQLQTVKHAYCQKPLSLRCCCSVDLEVRALTRGCGCVDVDPLMVIR